MFKTILICCAVVLCGVVWAGVQNTQKNIELPEQTGEEIQIINPVVNTNTTGPTSRASFNRLDRVLMIPDWTSDSVGLFDPYDGTFLRYLCKSPSASSPKNAIAGPDGNIYLADQVQDAVTIFDTSGTYLGIYADASDGLDNIRGIDFRDRSLFVCNSPSSGTKGVWEFSGPHTFVRHFITYTGVDPFDIYFLADGRSLFADIGTSDKIALHDTNGIFIQTVITTSFPEQIQSDPVLPGAFLAASFSSNQVIDFDLDGSIFRTFTLSGARGVYRLGNGNILATYGTAVIEMDSLTGATIQIEKTGSFQYIERYSAVSPGASETNNSLSLTSLVNIHPNPFKNRTIIEYNLLKPIAVSVKIYSCLGREVRTLVTQNQASGIYSVTWDGKDNNGRTVPNGIYICNLQTVEQNWYNQLILVK